VADPERRPALEDEEPPVPRRRGSRAFPPPPSESELLLFFLGSRSLRHGSVPKLRPGPVAQRRRCDAVAPGLWLRMWRRKQSCALNRSSEDHAH
jgi:hypothetical protein